MVEAAVEGGVNCFDTAAAYGSSEDVLGRALHELGVAERVVVVTKVRALTPEERADRRAAIRAIHESIAASRKRLGIDLLPIVLFHKEADAQYLDVLLELKERGWLRHAGVSCGESPASAVQLAAEPGISAMQIPANLLDQRHQGGGTLTAVASSGAALLIRSVYLQGLMLMPEHDIPEGLQAVVPVRRQFEAIARDAGVSMAELAVRYMLAQEGVTSVLTGVDCMDQLKENIAVFERGPLDDATCRAITDITVDLPEYVYICNPVWSEIRHMISSSLHFLDQR